MNGQVIASAVGASAFNLAAAPSSGSAWQDLAWTIASAVLAAVLSWFSARRPPAPKE